MTSEDFEPTYITQLDNKIFILNPTLEMVNIIEVINWLNEAQMKYNLQMMPGYTGVVLKFDYSNSHIELNDQKTAYFNIGVGYMF